MTLLKIIHFLVTHPLNRNQKFRSILRFLRWQVGSRLVPGPVVYKWINGSRFLVGTGETALTGNLYAGLYEFPDMAFLLHFLRGEDLFVDVGANLGSYTILACSAAGVRGIAFEPVPGTYKRLVENIRLNCLDEKARCINKGVGAGQGSLVFTTRSGPSTNHVLAADETADDTIAVDVTSLDAALDGECPALMKIDVEGYETPVLEGAKETLRKTQLQAVIMELNGSGSRYGFDESRIVELMFGCGFKTYSYEPSERRLVPLEGKNPASGNTLFIQDKSLVGERLRSAASFVVHGMKF
jgi:FkbM family methyltransferase